MAHSNKRKGFAKQKEKMLPLLLSFAAAQNPNPSPGLIVALENSSNFCLISTRFGAYI
jgi:hypothetical protein